MKTPLRVCFVLPGLHRVVRGAEVAFESVARELARLPGFEVTLIGSGGERPGEPYRFIPAGCTPRERFEGWPNVPVLRGECYYEELTFVPGLLRAYDPRSYDATVACSYPFVNWALRARTHNGRRPAHVFVTQNGDWPAQRHNAEYRLFGCEGLVCTNPEYYERNRAAWRSLLVPNGVDPDCFGPGPGKREKFGIPEGVPTVLMVSALIESKRVLEGIRCVAGVAGVQLVVAGDGPVRAEVERLGAELMPGRFRRLSIGRSDMPLLYRSADLFLHMSIIEPSANAYIEALVTGLPIVTHDRAVTRWTFDGRATLVDTTSESAVRDAIAAALASDTVEIRRARSAYASERYAWRRIAAEYAAFIRDVVADQDAH